MLYLCYFCRFSLPLLPTSLFVVHQCPHNEICIVRITISIHIINLPSVVISSNVNDALIDNALLVVQLSCYNFQMFIPFYANNLMCSIHRNDQLIACKRDTSILKCYYLLVVALKLPITVLSLFVYFYSYTFSRMLSFIT